MACENCESLKNDVHRLRSKNEDLIKDLESSRSDVDFLHEQVIKLKDTIKKHESEIGRLKKEKHDLSGTCLTYRMYREKEREAEERIHNARMNLGLYYGDEDYYNGS